jgi:hypothetical protein
VPTCRTKKGHRFQFCWSTATPDPNSSGVQDRELPGSTFLFFDPPKKPLLRRDNSRGFGHYGYPQFAVFFVSSHFFLYISSHEKRVHRPQSRLLCVVQQAMPTSDPDITIY